MEFLKSILVGWVVFVVFIFPIWMVIRTEMMKSALEKYGNEVYQEKQRVSYLREHLAQLEQRTRHKGAVTVEFEGVVYPTVRAAQVATGRTRGYILKHGKRLEQAQ